MFKNKGIILLIFLIPELILYSLRFVNLKSDNIFIPNENVKLISSNRKYFNKINGTCFSPNGYLLNQEVLLDSENINGYNPIFPKRLMKVVNASLGRDVNWMETVSLNVSTVSAKIFEYAGVPVCGLGISNNGPEKNIFYSFEIMDDQLFYKKIISNDFLENQKLIILKSDELLIPNSLDRPCGKKYSPEITLINEYKIRVNSNCDFYYINPQSYYPGWYAIDGKQKSLSFPAFGFLQGYLIKAGHKEIIFKLQLLK